MSFKENLLKKIRIKRLAREVLASIGPAESGQKVDKDAMRSLLEMSPYRYEQARDLDLYIDKRDGESSRILVLDNELPIYITTVEDVLIRKSPYIKEMAKIRNIIKILKDSDVKVSRKQESVKTVEKECIDRLDLSFNTADIKEIVKEGISSLENGYAEGVKESLALFAELLEYQQPPTAFRVRHSEIFGVLIEKSAGEIIYGPSVIFSLVDSSLRLLYDQISSFDKPKVDFFQQVAQGKERASVEGSAVFEYLEKEVLNNTFGKR
jgi:hypothetical protein